MFGLFDNDDEIEDGTEVIEATFGEIQVFVTSDDADVARENFDHAWEKVMDFSDEMHDRAEDFDDGDDRPSGRTFG